MSDSEFSKEEWRIISQGIARLRASIMAITFAIVGGLGLFGATAWLIVQAKITGASVVGPTLGLLSNYFPGYSVTWTGAFLGVFYGALVGAVSGYLVALIYNRVTRMMHQKRQAA